MSIHRAQDASGDVPWYVAVWRWISGHSADGKHRTDATWLHRGERALRDGEWVHSWHYLPRYARALWRIGGTGIVLATLYGLAADNAVTVDSVFGAVIAATVAATVYVPYRYRHARHHRTVVHPIWQIAAHITGSDSALPHHLSDIHRRHIHIPHNFRTNPNVKIRLTVPVTYEAQRGSLARLNALMNKRLGREFDAIPHLMEYPPYVEFVPAPSPPGELTFADILSAIEKSKLGQLILGMGTHNQIIDVDLDSESPHIALSMGVGGGKSSLLRLLIIQLIRKGCERIDILDIKRGSHTWAKHIPGVFVHTTMESMINAVAGFKAEMMARYDILEHDENAKFTRRALVIEEQNSLFMFAKQYWADFRGELSNEERNKTPKTCPLISDIGYALFMGRQSCMNVISVFQRMSATASGGGDMRDQYGCKILARFGPAAWRILVGTTPIPRSSKIPGRAKFVLGEDIRDLQMAFVTDAEAKADALAHARPDIIANDPLMTVPADNAGKDEPEPPMSLREMTDAEIIPVRYATAKRARTRAGENFPVGKRTANGIVYSPAEVQAWFISRGKPNT